MFNCHIVFILSFKQSFSLSKNGKYNDTKVLMKRKIFITIGTKPKCDSLFPSITTLYTTEYPKITNNVVIPITQFCTY